MKSDAFTLGSEEPTHAARVTTVGTQVRIVQEADVVFLSPEQAEELRDALNQILGEAKHG